MMIEDSITAAMVALRRSRGRLSDEEISFCWEMMLDFSRILKLETLELLVAKAKMPRARRTRRRS